MNKQEIHETASGPVSDLTGLLGMDTTLNRAADMLTAYAELVRRQGASQLDEHHYLPEVEQVCKMLREFAVAKPEEDAERYRWLCKQFEVTTLPCALERMLKGEVYVADGKRSIDDVIDMAKRSGA